MPARNIARIWSAFSPAARWRKRRLKLFRAFAIEFGQQIMQVERDRGDDQPAQRVGQKPPGRVENGGMVKAGGAGRRGRAAQALPGVEPEMVVVAAGRDEGGAGPA